jgi:hypothetical protein
MSEQQIGKVEVGVFDMSRLPVRWDHIDAQVIEQAVSVLDSSVDEQVQQLTEAKKSLHAVDKQHERSATASDAVAYKGFAFGEVGVSSA